MVPSQSYFQHRNGLQLSAAAQSAAASRPDLNGFQQQQQDFNYPKDPYRYDSGTAESSARINFMEAKPPNISQWQINL